MLPWEAVRPASESCIRSILTHSDGLAAGELGAVFGHAGPFWDDLIRHLFSLGPKRWPFGMSSSTAQANWPIR